MAKSQQNGLKKGVWSIKEDKLLIDYIERHGEGNWQTLPEQAGLNRCGKSCRLRWKNYLRPGIKRGRFSPEEEAAIIALHEKLGNKWSRIAAQLPGRTDNEIKNFWNTYLRKKLLRKAIESQTHRPIPDLNLLNLSPAQLLSVSNLYNFMNPNLDTALSLQANVIELMKIQILQHMLQIVNPNPLQYIQGYLNLDGTNADLSLDPLQARSLIADFTNVSPLLNQQQPSISNFYPSSDGDIIQSAALDASLNGSSITKTTEYSLPSLVSAAPESSTVNQMQSFEPCYAKPTEAPDHYDVLDAWENLVDDEAISPYGKTFWDEYHTRKVQPQFVRVQQNSHPCRMVVEKYSPALFSFG